MSISSHGYSTLCYIIRSMSKVLIVLIALGMAWALWRGYELAFVLMCWRMCWHGRFRISRARLSQQRRSAKTMFAAMSIASASVPLRALPAPLARLYNRLAAEEMKAHTWELSRRYLLNTFAGWPRARRQRALKLNCIAE